VAIQLRRLHASVLLVKALGGGWQNEKTLQPDMAAQ
jgi:outer membrane protein TolC